MAEDSSRLGEQLEENERAVGGFFRTAFEPYRALSDELLDFAGELVGDLDEGEPDAQHAVALIAARVANEARAAHHLIALGYPVQAYTLVATMLELMHTAAYIGESKERAKEYFEHTNRARAYPGGNVKSTIEAVGSELGVQKELIAREYNTFYRQMCLVKHGNPMAMSLGTVVDDEAIWIAIGPVLTSSSIRLAFTTVQQAVRYMLLVLTVFLRHHVQDARFAARHARLEELSDAWAHLNAGAEDFLASLDAAASS